MYTKLKTSLIAIASVITLDQLSKYVVLKYVHEVWPITSFLNFTVVFNRGISFGLLQSKGMLGFWLLTIGVTALCIWLATSIYHSTARWEYISTALVLGGALGNLTDRFLYGGVVDFIDCHYHGWHWYTFNIADAAIVMAGGALVFYYMLLNKSAKNKVHRVVTRPKKRHKPFKNTTKEQ